MVEFPGKLQKTTENNKKMRGCGRHVTSQHRSAHLYQDSLGEGGYCIQRFGRNDVLLVVRAWALIFRTATSKNQFK